MTLDLIPYRRGRAPRSRGDDGGGPGRFDLLTKPEPSLTKYQGSAVKKIARELLAKPKREALVLDWKKSQTTRAAVEVAVQGLVS